MAEVAREPKKKTKRYRALRMNLYFLIVFLLFTALIFKLGIVQIVEGDKHRQDAEKANAKTAYYPTPRGKMYDKRNRVAVDNQVHKFSINMNQCGEIFCRFQFVLCRGF